MAEEILVGQGGNRGIGGKKGLNLNLGYWGLYSQERRQNLSRILVFAHLVCFLAPEPKNLVLVAVERFVGKIFWQVVRLCAGLVSVDQMLMRKAKTSTCTQQLLTLTLEKSLRVHGHICLAKTKKILEEIYIYMTMTRFVFFVPWGSVLSCEARMRIHQATAYASKQHLPGWDFLLENFSKSDSFFVRREKHPRHLAMFFVLFEPFFSLILFIKSF